MLTQDQINRYRTDGFIVVPAVFDERFVRRMQDTVDKLVEKSRTVTVNNSVYDLEPTHTVERPRVRRIKKPHKVDPVFQEILENPTFVAMMRDLLGPNIRLQSSKINMKEAGEGSPVEWHQDWAFYPHTNEDLLAVGVMIDDCQMENGPLLVMPGSHQGPVYDHHADGYFCGAIDPTREEVDFSKAVPCFGKAGSISIHHVRALHGSAENTSPKARRLLFYMFTAADAWPLMGVPDLEEYDSSMLCGEITHSPRLVDLPVRLPVPPAPHQGSLYENQKTLKNRFFTRKSAMA